MKGSVSIVVLRVSLVSSLKLNHCSKTKTRHRTRGGGNESQRLDPLKKASREFFIFDIFRHVKDKHQLYIRNKF